MYQDRRTKLYLPDSVRPKASGYSEAGASLNRRAFRGFTVHSGAPNEDINWNNATLRQRGRMLYMAAPVAASAINTNRTKVVGVGLTLKSSVDREVLGLSPDAAKDWQRRTEKEFRLWADRKQNCDATGMNNFDGMQQAVARGRVKAPGFFDDPLVRAAWCGARWIGPVQSSLDPLKEAKAAALQIQHALKTHEQVAREMGGDDWDENVEQLAAENTKLTADGGGSGKPVAVLQSKLGGNSGLLEAFVFGCDLQGFQQVKNVADVCHKYDLLCKNMESVYGSVLNRLEVPLRFNRISRNYGGLQCVFQAV